MTDGSKMVFNFLKSHYGTKVTAQEVAKELNVKIAVVTGCVNSLVKKGYAVREEVTTEAGVTKYISLTDGGLNYDPDAPVAKAE